MNELEDEVVEVDEDVGEKVVKPEFKLRLSKKYAIDTDSRNIILLELYEKRVGKGKTSALSGIFEWRNVAYFQSFDRLAHWLVQNAMFTSESVEHMYEFADRVVELKKEIADLLKEKVDVKIG